MVEVEKIDSNPTIRSIKPGVTLESVSFLSGGAENVQEVGGHEHVPWLVILGVF
jgi:hypothetical protein